MRPRYIAAFERNESFVAELFYALNDDSFVFFVFREGEARTPLFMNRFYTIMAAPVNAQRYR